MTTDTMIAPEIEEKTYSLFGGAFYKENPHKVLGEPYEASSRFGKTIRYKAKEGETPLDAVAKIVTPEFIAEGVIDISAAKSLISPDPESVPTITEEAEIIKSINKTQPEIIRKRAAKKRENEVYDEPDMPALQSFEDVLRDCNLHVLQPKKNKDDPNEPDVYKEYMTTEEVKVFLWYMHSIGNTYKNKWLDIFDPYSLRDSDEQLMIKSWIKQGLIFYYEGNFIPKAIYLSGDMYDKQRIFQAEKSEISGAFGEDVAVNQEKLLKDAFDVIYNGRLKLDDPDEGRRLKIKPFSDFAKNITIKNWIKDNQTEEIEDFVLVMSGSQNKYGQIYWDSKKDPDSVSKYSRNTKSFDELSLMDAFKYWLKHGNAPKLPHNLTWQDIFDFYLDKKTKKDVDKVWLVKQKKLCKEAGEKHFSLFLAEVISENDRVKIELEWNKTFTNDLKIDYTKIPVAFTCAKNYPKQEFLQIKPEKREAVAFHSLTGSSLNAFQVGAGKTFCAIFIIAQALDAGHCKRPFIVVPNQVYRQFSGELKGILPHKKINDLYNLSKDYLNQFKDENDQIFQVDEGSITMLTYEGLMRLGFREETQLNMFDQLSDAISMLQSIDVSTKAGAKAEVREKKKLEGIVGTALSKSVAFIEDFGFDFVCFDEAHAMKKIFTQVKARKSEEGEAANKKMYEISSGVSSTTGVKGYFVCSYIQSLNKGKNVLLLTATPFTNSPLEVYSMLSLVAYPKLREMGLSNINDFFDNFCQMSYDLTVDASLKPVRKQIFKAFDNLIGLQKLIYKYMLYKDSPDLIRPDKWVLPYEGRFVKGVFVNAAPDEFIDTKLPMTFQQKEMMDRIISFIQDEITYEELSSGAEVDEAELAEEFEEIIEQIMEDHPTYTREKAEKEANKIINEGNEDVVPEKLENLENKEKAGVKVLMGVNFARNLALSPHLYKFSGLKRPTYKDYVEKSPKLLYIMKCVKSIKKWHEDRGEPVSGQIIYMDRGKNKFDLLKDYLVNEVGYNENEIGIITSGGKYGKKEHKAFVKDSFNGCKWNESLRTCNILPDQDRIKVIIGTSSIREGMNLQTYTTVLYNAFVDWNPTDQMQLEGRCWRQGNTFKNVRIVIPLVNDSMDSFLMQKLQEKSERINSIWNYDGQTNVLPVEELDPQEQKKALITNPRVIAEIDSEVHENLLKDEISIIQSDIEKAKNIIGFLRTREDMEKDLNQVIERIAPDKLNSSIDVKIKTFEKALEEQSDDRYYRNPLLRDVYGNDFVDWDKKLRRPYMYGKMKGALATLKKERDRFFTKYRVDESVGAVEFYIQNEQDKIKEIQDEINRINSPQYLDDRAREIDRERQEKKISFATVDERVAEFEKLNYLLEFKREERPDEATKYIFEEMEGCPPKTADGQRDISAAGIKKLELCIANIPQTKDFYVDADGNYTPERIKLHNRIIAQLREKAECVVGRENPIAILMGGVPGSGKTTYLKKYAPFLTKEKIFKIDADEIRAKLPEYKGWNSKATHRETQDIYLRLLDDISEGKPCLYDILWDGTMNRADNYLPLIGKLNKLNYKIYIIYVYVSPKVSMERVLKRYQNPNNDGRYVPMEVVREANKKGMAGFTQLKDKVAGYMLINGETGEIETGGEQIIEGRGYFDTEPVGNEDKIRVAKAKAKARDRDLRLIEFNLSLKK